MHKFTVKSTSQKLIIAIDLSLPPLIDFIKCVWKGGLKITSLIISSGHLVIQSKHLTSPSKYIAVSNAVILRRLGRLRITLSLHWPVGERWVEEEDDFVQY